jgi:hypothetical protein
MVIRTILRWSQLDRGGRTSSPSPGGSCGRRSRPSRAFRTPERGHEPGPRLDEPRNHAPSSFEPSARLSEAAPSIERCIPDLPKQRPRPPGRARPEPDHRYTALPCPVRKRRRLHREERGRLPHVKELIVGTLPRHVFGPPGVDARKGARSRAPRSDLVLPSLLHLYATRRHVAFASQSCSARRRAGSTL